MAVKLSGTLEVARFLRLIPFLRLVTVPRKNSHLTLFLLAQKFITFVSVALYNFLHFDMLLPLSR